MRKTLLPVLFDTLIGGNVISGAVKQEHSKTIDEMESNLPESHGLRLTTLMMGFCSALANLLDSTR